MSKIQKATVIEYYQAYYQNPLKAKCGEEVTILRAETEAEWIGWFWCRSKDGVEGWISVSFLQISGSNAVLIKDYDATECTVDNGELVDVIGEDHGWVWCQYKNQVGWLPKKNIFYHEKLPVLESERLDVFHLGLCSPIKLVQYFLNNQEHFSKTDPQHPEGFYTEKFWQDKINQSIVSFVKDESVRFVISMKENPEQIIGTINFTQICRGPFQACYMGYGLSGYKINQGLMTEGLKTTIQYIFDKKNIHRIMANYMTWNNASGRVLEKMGFVKEGLAKNYLKINGEWQDHVLTSLTNNRWKE